MINLRNKDGDITKVETPDEFIELFSENTWEFDYISEEIQELLMSWLRKFQNARKNSKIIYNNVLNDDYLHESELLDDLLHIENNDLNKWDD